MPYEGKHIVITGGAGAIGRLICKKLVDMGAVVSVIDRTPDNVDITGVTLHHGDLSSIEGISEITDYLSNKNVDVLINLAGIQYFGLFEEQPEENVLLMYMVNLVAPALLIQAVLPQMKRRGSGHIVNIGSTFGSINFAHFASYSSTKSGLKGLSEALRRELDGLGINVTYIAPRAVKTPLNNEKVMQLAQITKMHMDSPELVALKIVQAIASRKKEAFIGFPESLFVRVNAVLPRLVDKALAGNDRKARELFN